MENTNLTYQLNDITLKNNEDKIIILDKAYKALLEKIESKRNNIIELDFLFNQCNLLNLKTNKNFIYNYLDSLKVNTDITINFLTNKQLFYLIVYYYFYNYANISDLFTFIFNYDVKIKSKYCLILYISYLNLEDNDFKQLFKIINENINENDFIFSNEDNIEIQHIKSCYEKEGYNLYDYMKSHILYYMVYFQTKDTKDEINEKIKNINIDEYIKVCDNICQKYSYQYLVNWFNTLINIKKINYNNLSLLINEDEKKKQMISIKFFITIVLYSFQSKTESLTELFNLINDSRTYRVFNKSVFYRYKNHILLNNKQSFDFINFYNCLKNLSLDKHIKLYFEKMNEYLLN